MIDSDALADAVALIGEQHRGAVQRIVESYLQARQLADQAPTVAELRTRLADLGTAARRLAAEIGRLDLFTLQLLDPAGELAGDALEVHRHAAAGDLADIAGRAVALGELAASRLRRVDQEAAGLGQAIGRRRADALLGEPPRWRLVRDAAELWRASGRRLGSGEASPFIRFVSAVAAAAEAPADGLPQLARRLIGARSSENRTPSGIAAADRRAQFRAAQPERAPCLT